MQYLLLPFSYYTGRCRALLAALLLFCTAAAQPNTPPAGWPADSQARFSRIDSNRTRNYNFVQQTLNYAQLSYGSFPRFDLGSPKKWYWLSADILPQFVVGGRWTRFPIHFTARYKVRMYPNRKDEGDSSYAVRTPSYMPGATMYFPLHYLDVNTPDLYYLSLSIFHHSNGQDHDEIKPDGSTNLYNGNFSTNYIEPAIHLRLRKCYNNGTVAPCTGTEPKTLDYYGRLGYELHFGTATALKSSYGSGRMNLQLGRIKVKRYRDVVMGQPVDVAYHREQHRWIFNSTLVTGPRDRGLSAAKKRINADLHFHYRIPSSPNTSGFIGVGYYGSDPYNIYYEQNYFYIRAGVALGFFVTPNMIGLK